MIWRPLLGTVLLVAAAAAADPSMTSASLEDQRRDYRAALAAIHARQGARFKSLHQKLDGYVLRGHLDYEYLRDRLASTPVAEIHQFLADQAHTPWADTLRQKWLRQLADRGDWATFMSEYVEPSDDTELVCLYLGNRVRSDQQAAVMARIEALWLTGKRLPGVCDVPIAAWKKAGHMGTDKVWERIRLAMEARNVSLAGEVAIHLPPAERVWVKRWQAMYNDPARELDRLSYPIDIPVARMIVRQGVARLAQRNPEAAVLRWQRLKGEHQFFGEDEDYAFRAIGLIAAQRHMPEALAWLRAVSATPGDTLLHEWRVQAALRAGDWDTAKRFLAALPEPEQASNRWRYWRARALEAGDQKREANEIYAGLAGDRDFYGFLAADRVGAEYSMQHASVNATAAEIAAMLAKPGLRVAQEFYALGQMSDARRQWNYSMRAMNNRELQVAAAVARDWGWHDRAVYSVNLSGQLNDLELRFPILYRDVVETTANTHGIDPGLVYGVVRQESAFMPDARSSAGALGLMQLMPATGRLTSRKLKLPMRGAQALLDVENNVLLGVNYLKEVLVRNGGHQALATASYNAGPHRVAEWLPPDGSVPADVWVETIPYSETRGYVKNVLAFAAIYDHRLGQSPTRLSTRMPDVMSKP